jgi:ubiquinone/menaquinone biosynthesis C-methylase UbiE
MVIFKILLVILAVLVGLVLLWTVGMKIVSRLADHFHFAAPCPASFSWIVDNPIRKRYMRPVLSRIGIQPGERVLELGPGPGAFTVEAARCVGLQGSVVAVDIQAEMIARVEKRVKEAGLTNVETHVASAYELPLPDSSVDRAFVITVMAEIPDKARALVELHRVLKPGGVLSITEEFLDPDYPFTFETIRWAEAAGFRPSERFGNFWIYTLNFKK